MGAAQTSGDAESRIALEVPNECFVVATVDNIRTRTEFRILYPASRIMEAFDSTFPSTSRKRSNSRAEVRIKLINQSSRLSEITFTLWLTDWPLYYSIAGVEINLLDI